MLAACTQGPIPSWIVSVICLLGGAAVGLGVGLIVGGDLTRERIGKQLRDERRKRHAQRHRFTVVSGGHRS